ncbi:dTDP-4-dehydrorhamnose 3,5-epimerase family protein [Candidatus Woesearchaeota archaeon]|nr:dTDP-4-dehydrorhamnose 3,5-epimerase family protein [Candidatus Woesearchaeota archaeon]
MIDGVVVKNLETFSDDRGWLIEIFRRDSDGFNAKMSYLSMTKFGVVRGPHEHARQSDFFVFIGPGSFELHLWDNRKQSKTYGEYVMIEVGEDNKVSVLVPPGVVHGYKSISEEGSVCINLPNELYAGEGKTEEVDEIRHEDNPHSRFRIAGGAR